MPVASITVSAAAPLGTGPDAGDPFPLDHDIGPHRRRTGPVHHGPPTDDHGHACPSLFAGPRPAHPHPLAGEGLHALGPELDAESGLLPPTHGCVHVDGRHAVGVHEHRPADSRDATSAASASSLLQTEAQRPKVVSLAASTAWSMSS